MISRRLYNVIERLHQNFESDRKFSIELLEGLVAEFAQEIHIRGGRVWRRDREGYRCIHVVGQVRPLPEDFVFPIGQVPLEEMRQRRFIHRVKGSPDFDVPAQRALGVSSFTAFPVDQDLKYIVSIYFRRRPDVERDWPQIESFLRILSIFTLHLSEKRKEDRILGEIYELARNQQMSVLPQKKPLFPGYDVFGISLPYTVVGGDYFNFHDLYGPLLGVVVADVKGKGFSAAVQVTALHRSLQVLASTNLKIAYKADILNKAFHDGDFNESLIAMVYGELAPNGRFHYTNVAHVYPLFYRADSDVIEELDEGGPFLGLHPDAMYNTGIVTLNPGDILVLYTDGISELTSESGEEFGRERLGELVRRGRDLGAEALGRLILEEGERFAGTPAGLNDDRTLVVIRRHSSRG